MKTKIIQFLREEDGVTTLEYGVLAAVVAVVIGSVFYTEFSSTLTNLLGLVDTKVTNAAGASGAG
ncbi:Flp family type IVb pilin [Pandoraea sp.]|uniref:Flp family type IVb pilin n=1 Tax=Pandoraea sp. TaxID=1883445 RepID=UPI0011FF8A49|nr:Flp family type IVb pilin [Pandoraea sp.]TAL54722.1 MAG: Flp family type IVb pilin [Pandoraea sp.]TAM18510.1 MAG: Flp family type IVb pilin [Pandoraea sp.]